MEPSEQRFERPRLLVFTLGERCESRRRHLLPARFQTLERRLHQACLDAALSAGRSAGLRLQVSSPRPLDLPADVARRSQPGTGFGNRLRHALDEAFAAEPGPVVLVGTDVPGLAALHLHRTLELLAEDPERVVIGPSPDGGFYLLAANRPLDGALAAVRWCCGEALRSLQGALRRQGRAFVLLPPLEDLDRRADLERWLAKSARTVWHSFSWQPLLALLRALFAEIRQTPFVAPPPAVRFCTVRVPPLRGPPRPALPRHPRDF